MRERNTLRKALSERKITVHSRVKSNFCLTVGRNAKLLQFCITSLCDWSRNLAPLSQPIRSKTEANHDLASSSCLFLLELLLANDWSLGFLRFWFLRHSLENCAKGTYLGLRASSDKENCYPTG